MSEHEFTAKAYASVRSGAITKLIFHCHDDAKIVIKVGAKMAVAVTRDLMDCQIEEKPIAISSDEPC